MSWRISAALVGAALFAGAANAQETTIKFTLGWKTQGSDAAFFYAKDHGFFKEEVLNVVIDHGEGSGATVTFSWAGGVTHNVTWGTTPASVSNSGDKSSGTFQVTLNTAGTYNYHCTIHAGMNGSITVH